MSLLLSVMREENSDMLRVMTEESKPHNAPKSAKLQEELRRVVGRRLTVARTDMGLSQDDVLRELATYGEGRTQGSLSQIENGVRLPSLQVFYILAKRYDASANYLLGLSDDPRSLTDVEDVLADESDEERVSRLIRKLPREKQDQVVAFAEFLLAQEHKTTPINEFDEWVSATEVLMSRVGESGESSFLALLQRERPDLATALGIASKKKAV
jgi:transcriptional regulator with XRE-family HTH domain